MDKMPAVLLRFPRWMKYALAKLKDGGLAAVHGATLIVLREDSMILNAGLARFE